LLIYQSQHRIRNLERGIQGRTIGVSEIYLCECICIRKRIIISRNFTLVVLHNIHLNLNSDLSFDGCYQKLIEGIIVIIRKYEYVTRRNVLVLTEHDRTDSKGIHYSNSWNHCILSIFVILSDRTPIHALPG